MQRSAAPQLSDEALLQQYLATVAPQQGEMINLGSDMGLLIRKLFL